MGDLSRIPHPVHYPVDPYPISLAGATGYPLTHLVAGDEVTKAAPLRDESYVTGQPFKEITPADVTKFISISLRGGFTNESNLNEIYQFLPVSKIKQTQAAWKIDMTKIALGQATPLQRQGMGATGEITQTSLIIEPVALKYSRTADLRDLTIDQRYVAFTGAIVALMAKNLIYNFQLQFYEFVRVHGSVLIRNPEELQNIIDLRMLLKPFSTGFAGMQKASMGWIDRFRSDTSSYNESHGLRPINGLMVSTQGAAYTRNNTDAPKAVNFGSVTGRELALGSVKGTTDLLVHVVESTVGDTASRTKTSVLAQEAHFGEYVLQPNEAGGLWEGFYHYFEGSESKEFVEKKDLAMHAITTHIKPAAGGMGLKGGSHGYQKALFTAPTMGGNGDAFDSLLGLFYRRDGNPLATIDDINAANLRRDRIDSWLVDMQSQKKMDITGLIHSAISGQTVAQAVGALEYNAVLAGNHALRAGAPPPTAADINTFTSHFAPFAGTLFAKKAAAAIGTYSHTTPITTAAGGWHAKIDGAAASFTNAFGSRFMNTQIAHLEENTRRDGNGAKAGVGGLVNTNGALDGHIFAQLVSCVTSLFIPNNEPTINSALTTVYSSLPAMRNTALTGAAPNAESSLTRAQATIRWFHIPQLAARAGGGTPRDLQDAITAYVQTRDPLLGGPIAGAAAAHRAGGGPVLDVDESWHGTFAGRFLYFMSTAVNRATAAGGPPAFNAAHYIDPIALVAGGDHLARLACFAVHVLSLVFRRVSYDDSKTEIAAVYGTHYGINKELTEGMFALAYHTSKFLFEYLADDVFPAAARANTGDQEAAIDEVAIVAFMQNAIAKYTTDTFASYKGVLNVILSQFTGGDFPALVDELIRIDVDQFCSMGLPVITNGGCYGTYMERLERRIAGIANIRESYATTSQADIAAAMIRLNALANAPLPPHPPAEVIAVVRNDYLHVPVTQEALKALVELGYPLPWRLGVIIPDLLYQGHCSIAMPRGPDIGSIFLSDPQIRSGDDIDNDQRKYHVEMVGQIAVYRPECIFAESMSIITGIVRRDYNRFTDTFAFKDDADVETEMYPIFVSWDGDRSNRCPAPTLGIYYPPQDLINTREPEKSVEKDRFAENRTPPIPFLLYLGTRHTAEQTKLKRDSELYPMFRQSKTRGIHTVNLRGVLFPATAYHKFGAHMTTDIGHIYGPEFDDHNPKYPRIYSDGRGVFI